MYEMLYVILLCLLLCYMYIHTPMYVHYICVILLCAIYVYICTIGVILLCLYIHVCVRYCDIYALYMSVCYCAIYMHKHWGHCQVVSYDKTRRYKGRKGRRKVKRGKEGSSNIHSNTASNWEFCTCTYFCWSPRASLLVATANFLASKSSLFRTSPLPR